MHTATIQFEDVWLDGQTDPFTGSYDFDFELEQIVSIDLDGEGGLAKSNPFWSQIARQILIDHPIELQHTADDAGIHNGSFYGWAEQAAHQMGIELGEAHDADPFDAIISRRAA